MTIEYPAISKPEEAEATSQGLSLDSKDVAIICLSGALVLVVIALILILASR